MTRRGAATVVLALLAGGCFEDADSDEGTGTGAVGTNDTASDTASDTEGETGGPMPDPTSDPTGDPTGGGCMGCRDAEGGCLAGDLDEACGALAAACVACDAESFCDDGVCARLPACNADNCDGCCDGDDCFEGNEVSACGDEGAQCEACTADSTCNEGSCELPCETSCDGCCDASGDCIPLDSTDADACGVVGEACQRCDEGFDCAEGSCISTACSSTCDGCCDGATCNPGNDDSMCGGGGFACQDCPNGTSCLGLCTANEDASWHIVVLSATTSQNDENGDLWDSGGLPDPYVEITVAAVLESTAVVQDSTTPVWNETLFDALATQDLIDGITIELWDSDLTFDERMGECTFGLAAASFGVPTFFTCTNDSGEELWTLQFLVEATGA